MKRSGLTAARHPAVLVIVSGGCLALSACAGTPAGGSPAHTQSTAASAAAQKFCQQIATAMRSLDGGAITPDMKLARARTVVDKMMDTGVSSFTTLETRAPASIRPSIHEIVAYFRSYKKSSDKATSVEQLLSSVAHASPAEQPSYRHLLTYASNTC